MSFKTETLLLVAFILMLVAALSNPADARQMTPQLLCQDQAIAAGAIKRLYDNGYSKTKVVSYFRSKGMLTEANQVMINGIYSGTADTLTVDQVFDTVYNECIRHTF